VFRPHNVYGEYQNIGDRYRNVIGIFMNRLMQGQSMPIFGDGSQTRAFSYVGDIAPVMVDAPTVPESWGEVFNVGADRDYSVRDLAEAVARAMGTEPRIEFLEERKEVKHAYSDHSKVKRVFGERAETSLDQGLAAMAEWARSVGPRASQPFENIEVTRNLPPAWLR
jgi:UDP-glucose 4-epimerase